MIDFFDKAFISLLFGLPVIAGIAFFIGLFSKEVRWGILPGLLGLGAGMGIGIALGGGLGQTDGWGWGNVGAAIFGLVYAAVGFLIGFGAYCIQHKATRGLGWFFIIVGLIFPVAHFGQTGLKPAMAHSEMDWWKPILANGYTESSEDDAKAHLSNATRQSLNEYVYRHTTGDIKGDIPPSTLNLFFDLGIPVSNYVPLPADLAEKIYARIPGDHLLARNPSTPEDILEKFAQSNDQYVLLELARNKELPQSIADQLQKRYEAVLDLESKSTDPDNYKINMANDGLKALAKRGSPKTN